MSTREKLIKARLGMLALAEELQNISLVCRKAGISRCHFYEIKEAYEKWGAEGLAVRFQQVVHSTRTREADCVEQSTSRRDRMDIPKNARLTFVRREQLAELVILQGRTLHSAAAEFKVCARTAAKGTRRPPGTAPASRTALPRSPPVRAKVFRDPPRAAAAAPRQTCVSPTSGPDRRAALREPLHSLFGLLPGLPKLILSPCSYTPPRDL